MKISQSEIAPATHTARERVVFKASIRFCEYPWAVQNSSRHRCPSRRCPCRRAIHHQLASGDSVWLLGCFSVPRRVVSANSWTICIMDTYDCNSINMLLQKSFPVNVMLLCRILTPASPDSSGCDVWILGTHSGSVCSHSCS